MKLHPKHAAAAAPGRKPDSNRDAEALESIWPRPATATGGDPLPLEEIPSDCAI